MAEFGGGATAVHAFDERPHREPVRGLSRIHDVACTAGGPVAPDMSLALMAVA